ncbi:MAG: cupin domain-containing protein [Burkholderiaceae bacterium]
MQTLHIAPAQMETRIARFRDLQPLEIQKNSAVPEVARDVVYARKLLSVIGLEGKGKTPINNAAPIIGAAGLTMTLAVCPPGQGPGLHAHQQTFETFTVLQGQFEFAWNDQGENHVVLEMFDTISVPPGVCRAFRNVGSTEGILQVLITGGVHDMNDIAFSAKAADTIEAVAPGALAHFKQAGFSFNAARLETVGLGQEAKA